MYTGEVRTLTLALKGEGGSVTTCMYVINVLFAFNSIFHLSMNYDYCTYLEIVGGDSDTIYRAVMDVLEEYHVPFHKVIGLCSDGVSTMRGV